MGQITDILTILFLLTDLVLGFGSYHWHLRNKVEEVRNNKARESLKKQTLLSQILKVPEIVDTEWKPYPDQYLEQPLDHFDFAVKGTYRQRYWVNEDYWDKPNGPVFLYIGGEGGLSSLVVQAGAYINFAKKYGALIFAVEHRYYGQSINDDGLELENIQYLSSQQALADLASFHDFASKKFSLNDDHTWICFGGSYPGALSAWFRIKYPHLVYGAIASSAPVKAKVNFQGYNDVVASSLGDPIVNGSAKCVLNIKEAFKKIDLLLSTGHYSKLEEDFKSCKPFSGPADISQFASNLADVFMGTVQYNAEVPGLNVTGLCQMATNTSDAYENLKFMNNFFLKSTDQNCSDNSWNSMIKEIANTTIDRSIPGGVGIRQWIYQTCTQFGYYQTCDPNTTCLFSRYMSLKPNLDTCEQVFKVDPESVYKRVEFTNDYYGSDRPKGTRIVFVNGSIDPWHALSVLKDLSSSETAIYIKGTAHCANMHSDEKTDPPALRAAREEIETQIGKWLEEAGNIKNTKKDTKLYFRPY